MKVEELDVISELQCEAIKDGYEKLANLEPGSSERKQLVYELIEQHKILNDYIKISNSSTEFYDKLDSEKELKDADIEVKKEEIKNESEKIKLQKDEAKKDRVVNYSKIGVEIAKFCILVGVEIAMFKIGMGMEVNHPITYKTFRESKDIIKKQINNAL